MSFGGFVHTIMFSRPHCIALHRMSDYVYSVLCSHRAGGQQDNMLQVHLCLFGLVAKFNGWLKHSLLGCKYDHYCRLQPEPCNKCNVHLWRFVPSNIGQREAVWETQSPNLPYVTTHCSCILIISCYVILGRRRWRWWTLVVDTKVDREHQQWPPAHLPSQALHCTALHCCNLSTIRYIQTCTLDIDSTVQNVKKEVERNLVA